jgi:hypothetical protein
VDPLVSETGQPFSYADDDPVNASDPSGLDYVYILYRYGTPFYVGRTNNIDQRLGQHASSGLYCSESDEPQILQTGDISTEAAAGLEQRVIETLKLGNLDNQRNEIASNSQSKRWTYESATEEANRVLAENPTAADQIDQAASALGEEGISVPGGPGFFGELEIWFDNGGPGESGDDG